MLLGNSRFYHSPLTLRSCSIYINRFWQVALFWKSHCATCSPVYYYVILYHVTRLYKGPIPGFITPSSLFSLTPSFPMLSINLNEKICNVRPRFQTLRSSSKILLHVVFSTLLPWVPEVFFLSLGATELSGEAGKATSTTHSDPPRRWRARRPLASRVQLYFSVFGNFFNFVVCNPCQCSPSASLTILVPLWFIIISLLFLYISKVLFSGFLQLILSMVKITQNTVTVLF